MLEPEIDQRLNLTLWCPELPFSVFWQQKLMRETGDLEFLACEVEVFG